MKIWRCSICGYIHRGDAPPSRCPVCNAGASKFIEVDESSISAKQFEMKKTGAKSSKPDSGKMKREKNQSKSVKDAGLFSKSEGKAAAFDKIKDLLVKHHLHPIAVHTPNGILPVVVLLWLVSWIFGYDSFAKAALINLIFVITVLPFVVFTGFLEWQKKYQGALTLLFKIKIAAAAVTCVLSVVSLVWYLVDPEVLHSAGAGIFIFINIILLAAVGIAGHIGGKFVFKD